MTTLLYFEEYESDLSKALVNRKDIKVIQLYTTKNYKFLSHEHLHDYENSYIIDYYGDFDYQIQRLKKWLDYKGYKIDYFLNDSEYYLEYANKVARALGLEALSEKQVRWVRDKVDMKDRFNEIGLKTVDYKPINNKKEILEFMDKHNGEPIIFKPRRLMNSKDVYKIEKKSDLDLINLDLKPGKYMVESYCDDQEWSIESLVQNGKVLDSYITYLPNRTLWAAMNGKINCHMTMPKVPEYFKFSPKEFIQKIVDGMELKNGTMTIEVFIDKEGNVMPSELGWRLPGCQATKNHSLSYGFDMVNALIDISIHKPVTLKYQEPIVSVGDLYLPNKEGLITDISTIDELLKMPGVIDGEMFLQKGDISTRRRVGNDASGWVQVIGLNEQVTYERMKYIFNNFKIKSKLEKGEKENVRKK